MEQLNNSNCHKFLTLKTAARNTALEYHSKLNIQTSSIKHEDIRYYAA